MQYFCLGWLCDDGIVFESLDLIIVFGLGKLAVADKLDQVFGPWELGDQGLAITDEAVLPDDFL